MGAGVLRPFSPSCEHSVRRMRVRVAFSEYGSDVGGRVLCRLIGVAGLDSDSLLVADADCEDTFEVAKDLERGWSRDITGRRGSKPLCNRPESQGHVNLCRHPSCFDFVCTIELRTFKSDKVPMSYASP